MIMQKMYVINKSDFEQETLRQNMTLYPVVTNVIDIPIFFY